MRSAKILFKDKEAGVLTQLDDGTFTFQYDRSWVEDPGKPPVGLRFPKQIAAYHSDYLFPFFYNMLPEGSNRRVVNHRNQIDKDDYFSLLLVCANNDTIGAVRVLKIDK